MNLLLILSAILSALTGVGGGARVHETPAVAARMVSRVAHVADAIPAAHPLQVPPALVSVRYEASPAAFALLPAEPIFAGRRRE